MRTKAASRKLRVVVDGLGLVRDSAYRGIGTYSKNLIGGLATVGDLDLTVLVPRHSDVQIDVRLRGTLRIAPGRWARTEHDLLMPIDLRRTPGDVFFGLGQPPPRWAPYPIVQTLHDVYPLIDPAADPTEREMWQRTRSRWSRVAEIVANSQSTAADGVAHLGVPPARITVAYPGADPAFVPPVDDGRGREREPFFLLVAEYDPRKRHETAFAVMGAAAAEIPHRLLVAGRVARHVEDTIRGLVAAAPRPDRIDITGYLGKPELISLYQRATAVLVTSSHEGFGFPALEAMACGTPVIAFDNTGTSEVVGDAGILIPDGDTAAMTRAMVDLARDKTMRQQLAQSGPARAAEFTWQNATEVNADALRRAAGRIRG